MIITFLLIFDKIKSLIKNPNNVNLQKQLNFQIKLNLPINYNNKLYSFELGN